MNLTLRFFQKQGLKISLPLLLLAATACSSPSSNTGLKAKSSDSGKSPITQVTPTAGGTEVPKASGAGLTAPDVKLPDDANQTSTEVLPGGGTAGAGTGTGAGPGAGAGVAASVPEPAALAGLAIAAAGMIVLKRKQAA